MRLSSVTIKSTSTANAASLILGKKARTGLLPVRAFLFFSFYATTLKRTPVWWLSFAQRKVVPDDADLSKVQRLNCCLYKAQSNPAEILSTATVLRQQ